jgi:hypothetical protein
MSTRPSIENPDTEISTVAQVVEEPRVQQPEKMIVEEEDGQTQGKEGGGNREGGPVSAVEEPLLPAASLRSEYESTAPFYESVQELSSYFQELL